MRPRSPDTWVLREEMVPALGGEWGWWGVRAGADQVKSLDTWVLPLPQFPSVFMGGGLGCLQGPPSLLLTPFPPFLCPPQMEARVTPRSEISL